MSVTDAGVCGNNGTCPYGAAAVELRVQLPAGLRDQSHDILADDEAVPGHVLPDVQDLEIGEP